VRLHTNLEIYWDWIGWAEARPDAPLRTTRLAPELALLRYRGYSATVQPERSAPEVPIYDSLAGTAQRWRDLEGYYTRFGDVRELLAEIDDRYVIMNAGDELVFHFPALPDPPEGWVRDFVLIGDGWVKDGDYNTTFSRTVRPLALSRHARLRHTARSPVGRSGLSPLPRRLAALPHALRGTGPLRPEAGADIARLSPQRQPLIRETPVKRENLAYATVMGFRP